MNDYSTLAIVIVLAVAVFMIAAMWKVFVKAGQPGWGCLVPFYNMYLLLVIAGKPAWWFILIFVPIVNFFVHIFMWIGVGKAFGKETGFGLGLTFLPFIFVPMLAFGDAAYCGSELQP